MAIGMVWPIVKASPAGKLMEAGETPGNRYGQEVGNDT